MTPLPKRKISKGRRDRRRAHDSIKTFHLIRCSNCGEMKRSHHMCLECGSYKGRQVLPEAEE